MSNRTKSLTLKIIRYRKIFVRYQKDENILPRTIFTQNYPSVNFSQIMVYNLIYLHIYVIVFDKNFCCAPNWLTVMYMAAATQSVMMYQSYSGISIKKLNHVVSKLSNISSRVGHLVFSLGQWSAIGAYKVPWHVYIRTCLAGLTGLKDFNNTRT